MGLTIPLSPVLVLFAAASRSRCGRSPGWKRARRRRTADTIVGGPLQGATVLYEIRRCPRRSPLALDPRNGARRRPSQELGPDEHVDHVVAGRRIETPQTRGLLGGQPQAGHFEKLMAHSIRERVNFHRRHNHTPFAILSVTASARFRPASEQETRHPGAAAPVARFAGDLCRARDREGAWRCRRSDINVPSESRSYQNVLPRPTIRRLSEGLCTLSRQRSC